MPLICNLQLNLLVHLYHSCFVVLSWSWGVSQERFDYYRASEAHVMQGCFRSSGSCH